MPTPPGALDALVERLSQLSASAMGPALAELPEKERAALEAEVRQRLDALPVPVGVRASGPWLRRRHRLEQLLGWFACFRGDSTDLVEAARREWLQGGDHAAYLQILARHGDRDHAVRMALAILDQPSLVESGCETAAAEALAIPIGFRLALDALAAQPTEDAWAAMLRFTPADRIDERSRYAARVLVRRGLSPNRVFELLGASASEAAVSELAESGDVEPRCIAAVARVLPARDRARLLGLAARAAALRHQAFAAVRYLREARAASLTVSLEDDLAFVRSHGGAEVESLLSSLGFGSSPALD